MVHQFSTLDHPCPGSVGADGDHLEGDDTIGAQDPCPRLQVDRVEVGDMERFGISFALTGDE